MSVNLITGYAGTAHITAAGDGAVNAGMFGSGKYVLNVGEKFGYEVISNNLIRIKSGYAINQGRKIELAVNDYEEVEIDNGLQGVKRCDLIAITYERNVTTGIETATINVIKGTSSDSYVDPEYTTGDILIGAEKDDFLLYRVKINGLSIEAVEPLFTVTESVLALLATKQDKLTNPLTQSDVINNLTSTSAVKPLSANQGKVLSEDIAANAKKLDEMSGGNAFWPVYMEHGKPYKVASNFLPDVETNASKSISCASGDAQRLQIGNASTKGLYEVKVTATFPANEKGVRNIHILKGSSYTGQAASCPGFTSVGNRLHCTWTGIIDGETMYLEITQTSGSLMNVQVQYELIRLYGMK